MSALKSISAFLAALAVTGSVGVGYAQGVKGQGIKGPNQDLPELGSPANAAISIDDEYHAGLGYVNQIRNTGLILTDPEVSQYAQEIGHSLSSRAEEGQHQFYYFVLRDPIVNAFAVPGGFVAIHSGLILATRNENELAGVLAHETAHVTQRHIVRQIMDQSHEGLLASAAMLAAVLLGATAGRGSPDAIEGAILAGQSAMIQHQINYTRASEFEADRIGISTAAEAGYDPLGMASFFDYMGREGPEPSRVNAVQFLIDHPIFSDRVAEARDRADQIGRIRHEDSLSYRLIKERLRSVAADPQVARQYYVNLLKNGGGKTIEERYGKDVAEILTRNPAGAIPDLQELVREYPKVTQFYGALGQAYLANNQLRESEAVLERAMTLFPRNVPITIRLAETLMRSGDNKRAHLVLLDLFNNVEPTPDQTRLIAKAANTAGDYADSYGYMAEFYLMTGNLQMASNQLQMALTLPNLDAVQRARYSARLEEVRAAMPKKNKDQVAEGNRNNTAADGIRNDPGSGRY
jgi:predicted Zn-dependent protease